MVPIKRTFLFLVSVCHSTDHSSQTNHSMGDSLYLRYNDNLIYQSDGFN